MKKNKLTKMNRLWIVSGLLCSVPLSGFAMGKSKAANEPGPAPSMQPQNPSFMSGAVQSILNAELALRTKYRGEMLGNILPKDAANMSVTTASFVGGLSHYISENPSLFGGDPDRGFTPKIFNAMVKVLMERSVPMTSDGILLSPRTGLNVVMYGTERTASGAVKNARLFLVDDAGQLIGPSMKPIQQKGFETLDGGTVGVGSQRGEFAAYGHLSEALQASALVLSGQPIVSSAVIQDPPTYSWSECFGLAADNNFDAASECFKAAGNEALAEAAQLGRNVMISGVRGAIGGALVGSAVPGIGTGEVASYGALVNVMSVVYNTFLRKETMTPQQIRNLMELMETYTYSPTVYGEILPKDGQWAVTKEGMVRRVTDFGNGQLVLLDVQGNMIMKDQSIVLQSDTFRPIKAGK